MKTILKCECCGEPLYADLCNNVWCENKKCFLYDELNSYVVIKARAEAKAKAKAKAKETMP